MVLNKDFLQKAWFWQTKFSSGQILNQLFYKASDFKSTFWARVRFRFEYFTARQILSVFLLQFGKFSCFHHKGSRFRNVLRYDVGSVSQNVLLE